MQDAITRKKASEAKKKSKKAAHAHSMERDIAKPLAFFCFAIDHLQTVFTVRNFGFCYYHSNFSLA